ncbi:MAG TPA: hypothetical protein VF523_08340, partial [Burkholderiales bacterium]
MRPMFQKSHKRSPSPGVRAGHRDLRADKAPMGPDTRPREPARPGWPARSARLAYEYFVFYLGYLYFGIGCALGSLACAALHPLLPDELGTRLGRRLTGIHFRGFLAILAASGLVRIDLAALDALR